MTGYAKAEQRPSPNFWAGFDARDFIVIHATASGDSATEFVPDFSANTQKSTHYAIAMDGTIVQYVDENNSAWGNCCASGNSTFRQDYNWNKSTVSIENEKHSTDNSTALTPQQYQSLLVLVRDIAARWKIPLVHGQQGVRGIIYHHDIDPVNKPLCPGNFPYDTFFQDLAGSEKTVKLDNNGCVMTFPKSYQLESGESQDLCGPWSVVAAANSVPPGQTPQASNESVDTFTDNMVDKLFGPGGFNHDTFQGVMPADMITIMNYVRDNTGLIHYWVIDPKNIPLAVAAGYPCLFSLPEGHILAWDKNSNSWVQAYPWRLPNNFHVLPVAGFDNNHNWICPDQLNNSFQGYWPPIYQESQIVGSISWAAVIQVVGPDKNNPWLKTIPSGDPSTWPASFSAQLFGSGEGSPPPTPPPSPTVDNKAKAFTEEWQAVLPGIATSTGIAKAAYATYWTSNFAGPATSKEFQLIGKDGKAYTAQTVLMGVWLWDGSSAHYYAYKAG